MDDKNFENDNHIIEACLKKDISAWAALVKKYSSLVYISIENRLKKYNISISRQDIEDIRQNVFADIWKNNKLKDIVNREDISYWISVLSGNAAIENFRNASARISQKTVSLSSKLDGGALEGLLPSGLAGQRSDLDRAEAEEKIDRAINSLPGREKIMAKLHLIHNKKYHEIAELMGVPEGTVSSYVKRAKERLRKALKNI
ncbi:MAG: sigma-70 family RNA polymerase sigma factor [Candidatus Omnitrophica bacterium]|nr:sigma-70 family RNA polymerase sigma factor [Candidatus Omnitrophota bacterium]